MAATESQCSEPHSLPSQLSPLNYALSILILRWIVDAGVTKGLDALAAGAALAAMLLATLVARVGHRVIHAHSLAVTSDVGLAEVCVRREDLYALVGALLHRHRHGIDKRLSAIGIDGMVTGMVGNHHAVQSITLGNAAGNGKHDAVAEWHHSRLHVLVVVVALRNLLGAIAQQCIELLHTAAPYGSVLSHSRR